MDELIISTPEEWLNFAIDSSQVGTSADEHLVVKITNDLDFDGIDLSSYNMPQKKYISLDGQGHTIKGLNINKGTSAFYGFIYFQDSFLENLTFSSVNYDCQGGTAYFINMTSSGNKRCKLYNLTIDNKSKFYIRNAYIVYARSDYSTYWECIDKIMIAGYYEAYNSPSFTLLNTTSGTITRLAVIAKIVCNSYSGATLNLVTGTNILRSFSRIEFIVSSFLGNRNRTYSPFGSANLRYCYTANKWSFPNDGYTHTVYPLTRTTFSPTGLQTQETQRYNYYDKDLLEGLTLANSTGTTTDYVDGLTTAELKDIDYMKTRHFDTPQGSSERTVNVEVETPSTATPNSGVYNYGYIYATVPMTINSLTLTVTDYRENVQNHSGQVRFYGRTKGSSGMSTRYSSETITVAGETPPTVWTFSNLNWFLDITSYGNLQFTSSTLKVDYEILSENDMRYPSDAFDFFDKNITSMEIECNIDESYLWRFDVNNEGYPWTWGFTEISGNNNIFLKTAGGLVPLTAYYKGTGGLVPLTFIKTKE